MKGRHINPKGCQLLASLIHYMHHINFLHVIPWVKAWNRKQLTSRRTPPLCRKIWTPSYGAWKKKLAWDTKSPEQLKLFHKLNAYKRESNLFWPSNSSPKKDFSFSSAPIISKVIWWHDEIKCMENMKGNKSPMWNGLFHFNAQQYGHPTFILAWSSFSKKDSISSSTPTYPKASFDGTQNKGMCETW